jgi:hypothetical protein
MTGVDPRDIDDRERDRWDDLEFDAVTGRIPPLLE